MAVEDEGVKPAGWAFQTPVGGTPDVPTVPVCPSFDSGTGCGAVHTDAAPAGCPRSSSISSPHGLLNVSGFSKLLTLRHAGRFMCPGLSTAISLAF